MWDPKSGHRTLSIDALTSSVDMPLAELVAVLNGALGTTERPARTLPGMGYQHAAELVNPETLARRALVMYGAAHTRPLVYAMGVEDYDSPALYDALTRHCTPYWTPSRIDVALDFYEAPAFDVLAGHLIDLAKSRGIKLNTQGDWIRGEGRTLYVGARTSAMMLRLYEFRAHHGYGPPVRLELEIKAKPAHRLRIAAMAPGELLRMSPIAHETLKRIGIDGERTPMSPGARPRQSLDRDVSFLARQAWPALLRLVAHYGDVALAFKALDEYRVENERVAEILTGGAWCDTLREVQHLSYTPTAGLSPRKGLVTAFSELVPSEPLAAASELRERPPG